MCGSSGPQRRPDKLLGRGPQMVRSLGPSRSCRSRSNKTNSDPCQSASRRSVERQNAVGEGSTQVRSRRRSIESVFRVNTPGAAPHPSNAASRRERHKEHTWVLPFRHRDAHSSPRSGGGMRRPRHFPRRAFREIVRHFVHRHEFHAGVGDHVLVEPLEHHQHMRAAGNVRVNRHREDGIVHIRDKPTRTGRATSARCRAD